MFYFNHFIFIIIIFYENPHGTVSQGSVYLCRLFFVKNFIKWKIIIIIIIIIIIKTKKKTKQKHLLNLYFDENDILRSQTCINQIKCVVLEEIQPVLLRSNSYFTELIVLKCHNEVKHSGLESTLNRIRCKYWLIRERSTGKSIIRKCVICHLMQVKCLQPPLTPLFPEHRMSCQSRLCWTVICLRQLFKICKTIYSIYTRIYMRYYTMYTFGNSYLFGK